MIMERKQYDYIIIGGGIFGVYASVYLAQRKLKVCLIEKEEVLLKKASIVNQARLHAGYHYPRSIGTALIADEFKVRFTKEHEKFINFKFEKYYAIDRFGSFTDSAQFKRFCDTLHIKAEPIKHHSLINSLRIEQLFLTEEYSFDPMLIASYYEEKVTRLPGVDIMMKTHLVEAYSDSDTWIATTENLVTHDRKQVQAQVVINATYCGTNTINKLFHIRPIKLMHEITEMAMVTAPKIQHMGLTIMDGHFVSIMPYGLSGMLSLSSVTYTHHKVSYEDEPTFDCQQVNKECRSDLVSICNLCEARPKTNQYKMMCQIKQYLSDEVDIHYSHSMYTIKAKLQSSFIDDGRPTEISKFNNKPDYYCLFAGKINSIYEIEKFIKDEL
jgi:hypothetical protein